VFHIHALELTIIISFRSDVWAIGVIAFMLLSGRAPFPGSTEKSVFKRIKRGVISFEGESWAHVSPFAVSFVNSLLIVDPNARLVSIYFFLVFCNQRQKLTLCLAPRKNTRRPSASQVPFQSNQSRVDLFSNSRYFFPKTCRL